MYRYLFFLLLILPNISFASIRFNEIAWMGTVNSGADEWIELYNDGPDNIALEGYSIITADGNLKINLNGEIKSNGYYLIERTDDNSVPDITANLVASFGSGLSNTGEDLKLLDSNGSAVDEIISGDSWKSVGGDSTSKDTAQFTSSGWITEKPTPKAQNPGEPSVENNNSNTNESSAVSSSDSHTSVKKKKIDSYTLETDFDNSVVTNINSVYKARLFDSSGQEIKNPDIRWNFGDGVTGSGGEVKHEYIFDGVYPLNISAHYYNNTVELKTKITVSSLDIKIIDSKEGEYGYIKLKSNTDLDISGFSLRNGNSIFTFKEGSLIFAKTPITLANVNTGIIKHDSLALFNSKNKIVSVTPKEEKITYSSNYYGIKEAKVLEGEILATSTTSATSSLLLASVGNSFDFKDWIYWTVPIFFIVAIAVIMYASRAFNKDRELEAEAAKYTLVEIDSNLE